MRKDCISKEEYFMSLAILSSMRSKDPNTQVGTCLISQDSRILSVGYNGMPNGCEDEQMPWGKDGGFMDTKYAYVVHAEQNCILNFRGNNTMISESILYTTLFPCNECAKAIIQIGIKELVYLSDKYKDSESTIVAKKMFDMAQVKYREYKGKILNISY